MPLPSTRVFHPHWADRVAPVTEGAMNATVTISVADGDAHWVSGQGMVGGGSRDTYTGPARITYAVAQARQADAALQEVTERRVTVTLPRDAELQEEGAVVHVDAITDPNAPSWLPEAALVVGSVSRSSYAWEQLLDCTDDQTVSDEGEAP